MFYVPNRNCEIQTLRRCVTILTVHLRFEPTLIHYLQYMRKVALTYKGLCFFQYSLYNPCLNPKQKLQESNFAQVYHNTLSPLEVWINPHPIFTKYMYGGNDL